MLLSRLILHTMKIFTSIKIILLSVTVILQDLVERGIGIINSRAIIWMASCSFMYTGQLILSPMSVATVSRDGDPLQLTCTASIEFIRWNILQSNEQGALVEVVHAQINSRDASMQMSQRELNSATLTFMRTSAQGASPLITTLSIDSVSIGLNGTVVHCSDAANQTISASTTIQIIDIG